MTTQTLFSGDDLARHPHWKCLTTKTRYEKTGRRKFQLVGPDSKLVPPVFVTKNNALYYTFSKVQLHTVMPETYELFLKILQNHNYFVVAMMTRPPRQRGWDGSQYNIAMRMN